MTRRGPPEVGVTGKTRNLSGVKEEGDLEEYETKKTDLGWG